MDEKWMMVQSRNMPYYRPLPPGKSSRTFRALYLFSAILDIVMIFFIILVLGIAALLGSDSEVMPFLLVALAFLLVFVMIILAVLEFVGRTCFVRDHVNVQGTRPLFAIAVWVACVATVIAVAVWTGVLFGPELLRGYLGGSGAPVAASVVTLPAFLAVQLSARLGGLRKL